MTFNSLTIPLTFSGKKDKEYRAVDDSKLIPIWQNDNVKESQNNNSSLTGDSELTDYMDSLARDPVQLVTPHNSDTGETVLHLLAKEGKIDILQVIHQLLKH